MPKDKTETHERLLRCIRKEFLEHGYEKASLKKIASEAGITAAGIYRHFASKEAMFTAMVEPVTGRFLEDCASSMEESFEKVAGEDFPDGFGEYRTEKNREFVSFMYDNYDVFRLLLVCSKGTPYEDFGERLIDMEVRSIMDMFDFLDRRGIPHNEVTESQLHILCTSFVTAVCETVRHGYSREEAMEYLDFIGKMFYPGMRAILGF